MKYLLFISLLFLSVLNTKAQLIEPSNSPNPAQQRMIDRGYGMFITYGINTFAEIEWSDGTIPAEKYNPTDLDCDQWIRVARDAGFRYILLTTKHHDGFCLWDSKYTEYDVASSPVKTDVVAEVAKACKKYGIQFAVYYSLWDRNAACYKDKDPEKYVDYMCNQLTELLTNYGPICEVWFDGGWDKAVKDWSLPRVYKLIKKLQPDCVVGVNHTVVLEEGKRNFALPDSMVVDNKYYFQYFPSDFRLWDPKLAHKLDKKQYIHEGKSYYLPFEHTICISKYWSWYAKQKPQPTRSLDELEELFYWCTDNNNTLLLNIPPDQTGQIREHEANAAIALKNRIGLEYGKALPRNGDFISLQSEAEASSYISDKAGVHDASQAVDGGLQTYWASKDTLASLTISLKESEREFNKLSIFEYGDRVQEKGDFASGDGFTNKRKNRIQEYTISIMNQGKWEIIYVGDEPMSDCKVIRFPKSYKAEKIRLDVLKALAPPRIYEFNVINES